MTSETDAEFVERIARLYGETQIVFRQDVARLFALARRGAGLTLDRKKLFTDKDGGEWVDEYYSRRVPLPPPPAGETNE